jgi:uncharacterized membrane protein YfcA
MTFMPHFLPSHTAAATISALWSLVTAAYNSVRYRKNISMRTALPMLGAALVSIPIAVYFSGSVSGRTFEILLGVVLILLSLYFIFFNKHIRIKPTVPNGIIAGTLGGTLNGLFSTGGPPIVLYLSSATPDKLVYFATIQFYFCVTNIYATAARAVSGMLTADVLIYALFGMAGCMLGDFFGKSVFDRIDSDRFKRVIYIGMIISGIIMFF